MKKIFFILIAIASLLYGTSSFLTSLPPQLKKAEAHSIIWTDCWFSTPLFRPVHCGYLRPDVDTQIPIVVLRHSFIDRNLKPLLFINGGPGDSTILSNGGFDHWEYWIDSISKDHDLVLFDYLGTGNSKPSYRCPEFPKVADTILAKSLTSNEEAEVYDQIARKCYASLVENDRDLSKLTLPYQIKYISSIFEAIPDAEWDVYGVSYGTRVSLALLHQPPENVRKIVLDGVLPLDIDTFLEEPALLHQALQNLFDGCQKDSDCNRDFNKLEKKFYHLVNSLQESPLKFEIVHPYTQVKIPIVINGHRLISLVYLALYRWDFIPQLPNAIFSSMEGDLNPLYPMVEDLSWYYFDRDWNDAMFISIGCSEKRFGITSGNLLNKAKSYPRLFEYLSPMWTNDACDYWNVPRVPAKYHRPVKTSVPVLLLSGSYDPVTPPSWAAKAKVHLNNAYSFEFSGIGHGTIMSDSCAQEVMKQFLLDEADLKNVNCVEETQDPMFVTKKIPRET